MTKPNDATLKAGFGFLEEADLVEGQVLQRIKQVQIARNRIKEFFQQAIQRNDGPERDALIQQAQEELVRMGYKGENNDQPNLYENTGISFVAYGDKIADFRTNLEPGLMAGYVAPE